MHKTTRTHTLFLAGLVAFVLAGCGGPQVYRDEAFEKESPYYRHFPLPHETACDGARRALLSQGYVVDDARTDRLKGVKQFQPDEDIHMVMEFDVVCADRNGTSTIFANAMQTRYDLKKIKKSAGLSLPSLGSISLPWGTSVESLVKVGCKTIEDEEFYQRFFQLTRQMLGLPTKKRR
jgi:hypothetical protein